MMREDTLVLRHRLGAPRELVWAAWTDPEMLTGWDPDRVVGSLVEGQRFEMHWDCFGVSLEVDVVRRRDPSSLILGATRPDGRPHELSVEMQESGEGTELRLCFTGEMSEDERAGTASGWHTQLRLLDRYLSLPEPRPLRQSFAALGPAICSVARAFEEFAAPSAWLSNSPLRFAHEGQDYALITIDGASLRGQVLSYVEGRELALWCEELFGVVRMRALPLADGRARLLGIQVVRWGEAAAAHPIQESLRESVNRLLMKIGGPSGSA